MLTSPYMYLNTAARLTYHLPQAWRGELAEVPARSKLFTCNDNPLLHSHRKRASMTNQNRLRKTLGRITFSTTLSELLGPSCPDVLVTGARRYYHIRHIH